MNCPVCRTSALAPHQLDANVFSQRCGECGGQWISSLEFSKWIQSSRGRSPETPPAAGLNVPVEENAAARICPECAHILARYRVGHALDFSLERCGNCGGTWFDRNEWEILQGSGLRDKIHLIFSPAWQQQVRDEDHARQLQKLFADKVGEKDFAEIQRIRDWLNRHPHRRELRAYLDSEEF